MKPVERVDLSFVAAAVGQSLLRKVAGYVGGVGDHVYAYTFRGFSEQDGVAALGRILDAIGYDVYYEYPYPHGGHADICAESWQDEDAIWAEVKLLWDSKDKRLNAARYYAEGEFTKDKQRFLATDGVPGRHLFLLVGLSPSLDLDTRPPGTKTLRLGDVVNDITEHTNVSPTWHRSALESHAPTAEHTSVLHTLAWTKTIAPTA